MRLWQVDSFTDTLFKGNPAAVCVYERPLDAATMLDIAVEMHLSETAFIQLRHGLPPLLRWFTPAKEVDFCGHATLAAAHIYFTELNGQADCVVFDTVFIGALPVNKIAPQRYQMAAPLWPGAPLPLADIPALVLNALAGATPEEAVVARDLVLVYRSEAEIRRIEPDFAALKAYAKWVCITAPSANPGHYDFVSRFFCADDGTFEDPVTGSSHCTLTPYWATRLGKTQLVASQASRRGGMLQLTLEAERVQIAGDAVTVFVGHFCGDL